MNSFFSCRNIEKESRIILDPLLHEASNGRVVYFDTGRLALDCQKKYGDLVIQDKNTSALWSIELKAELRKSDNLFLEHWSNGSQYTPGWMVYLDADLLLYHFLESNELYIIKFQHLKRWFHFGDGFKDGKPYQYRPACERFPLKMQTKYEQKNNTLGRCVPINVIQNEVGLKLINPNSIALN